MQISLANYAEIFAAVVCTYCCLRKPSVLNRWFTPFLWLTIGIEFTGKLLVHERESKMLMYNIFNWIEFIFYLSLFYLLATEKKHRQLLLLFIAANTVFCLLNVLWMQGLWKYNSYSLVLGSLFLIIGCLREYLRLFYSDPEQVVVVKWPSILITTGLLLFYAGSFAFATIMSFLISKYPKTFIMLYGLVNHNLNVVLYLLFASAFIIELRNRPMQLAAV